MASVIPLSNFTPGKNNYNVLQFINELDKSSRKIINKYFILERRYDTYLKQKKLINKEKILILSNQVEQTSKDLLNIANNIENIATDIKTNKTLPIDHVYSLIKLYEPMYTLYKCSIVLLKNIHKLN